jgi:hypothetical protein
MAFLSILAHAPANLLAASRAKTTVPILRILIKPLSRLGRTAAINEKVELGTEA